MAVFFFFLLFSDGTLTMYILRAEGLKKILKGKVFTVSW